MLIFVCLIGFYVTSAGIIPGEQCGVRTPIKFRKAVTETDTVEPCTIVNDKESFSQVILSNPDKAGNHDFAAYFR